MPKITELDKSAKIFTMYLSGHTNKEISKEVGLSEKSVYEQTTYFLSELEKGKKNLAEFTDESFETPIYNVWAFAKKTNEVSHFGNSEVPIYTTPN